MTVVRQPSPNVVKAFAGQAHTAADRDGLFPVLRGRLRGAVMEVLGDGELCTRWIRCLAVTAGGTGRGGSVSGMTLAGLALIGVPANSSGTVDGVARAPAVLRQRGLAGVLARRPGFTDAGDLVLPGPVPVRGPSGLLAEDALVGVIGRVVDAGGAARRRGWFPLLVGGDCPVILGALAAVQAETDRPGLLFVDG